MTFAFFFTTIALAKVVAAKSLPLDGGRRLGGDIPDHAVDAFDLGGDLLGDHGNELERKFDDSRLDELRRRNGADRDDVTERARSVDHSDGLDVRHYREELLGLLVELGLGHLVAEDEIGLAEDVELLLRELAEAAEYLHSRGKKMYLTVNILPHGPEYPALREFIRECAKIDIDGYIVADLGVIAMIKEINPSAAIHISTQASIVSPEAALAYVALGAKRLVLARELTLSEIKAIKAQLEGR